MTDRLARLFIDETIKSREQQVEGAVDFLVTQVKDARTELENKDAALRRYKEEHMGKLPEQLETNLATMQMLQREMQTVEESLLFAREKQEALARGVGRSAAAPRPRRRAAAGGGGAGRARPPARRPAGPLQGRAPRRGEPAVAHRPAARRAWPRRAGEAPAGDAPADADPSVAVAREQLERANLEVRKLEDRQRDLQRADRAPSAPTSRRRRARSRSWPP